MTQVRERGSVAAKLSRREVLLCDRRHRIGARTQVHSQIVARPACKRLTEESRSAREPAGPHWSARWGGQAEAAPTSLISAGLRARCHTPDRFVQRVAWQAWSRSRNLSAKPVRLRGPYPHAPTFAVPFFTQCLDARACAWRADTVSFCRFAFQDRRHRSTRHAGKLSSKLSCPNPPRRSPHPNRPLPFRKGRSWPPLPKAHHACPLSKHNRARRSRLTTALNSRRSSS